jgi:hypothetical protein
MYLEGVSLPSPSIFFSSRINFQFVKLELREVMDHEQILSLLPKFINESREMKLTVQSVSRNTRRNKDYLVLFKTG